MDPRIKQFMEMQAGLSPEQDVERLRQEQEAAQELRQDNSQYGGLMNVARGLTFNVKGVDSPDAFIKQQNEMAGQPVTDVINRQKSEMTDSDAVRQHMLQGLQLEHGDKQLKQQAGQNAAENRFKKTAQTLQQMESIGKLSHQKEEEQQGRDKLEIDRLVAEHKATQEKQPSQSQSAAASYAVRAQEANKNLDALAAKGYDRASTGERINNWLPNEMVGEERQLQDQGESNFINATLRRDSGASISKDEYAKAEKQYFPRPGDTQAVVEQKRRNREIVTSALTAEGGPAMGKIAAIGDGAGLPPGAMHASTSVGKSGMTGSQRRARIAELRSKQGQ